MIEIGKRSFPTVLVVDDEPEILASLADLLRKEFHVLATSDTDEALQTLEAEDVAIVLVDQRMPGLSGSELLARASRLRPETVRVLITGYSDIEAVVQAVNEGHVFYCVTKPWNPADILGLLRTAVQTHDLAIQNLQLLRELAQLGEDAGLKALRTSLAPESRDALSKDLDFLRAALAEAREALGQVGRPRPARSPCPECAARAASGTGG